MTRQLQPTRVDRGEPAERIDNVIHRPGRVDALGYTRYWLAEHHNTPSIASSAPEIPAGKPR